MFYKTDAEGTYLVGIGIATKKPYRAFGHYYHKGARVIVHYNQKNKAGTSAFGFLGMTTSTDQGDLHLLTTHLMDTEHGQTDSFQTAGLKKLLSAVKQLPAHILCGDFNIPRGYNSLYPVLTKHYTDTIPQHYKSSLDRSLHRLGGKPLDEPIFEKYMVDYILSQPPYKVAAVELRFGVSDHAAVIAHLEN